MGEIYVTMMHLGQAWQVVKINSAFYARDSRGNDTGPYSTVQQALEFIEGIRP